MFDKDTYIRRRRELKKLVGDGVIVLFGNNNSPANFPNNGYHPFRQDSSFLYYFGQQREGLVGVIDVDNDVETLVGDDISIDDIVWYGSVDSVSDMAGQVGVAHSAPMSELENICKDAQAKKRTIHFLPPYRHDIMIQIYDLLGIHPKQQTEKASMKLIKAVVKMRSAKEPQEIEELERAAVIGYKMHTTAMRMVKPGHRATHRRNNRRNCQRIWLNGQLPYDILPACRNHARFSLNEFVGRRTPCIV